VRPQPFQAGTNRKTTFLWSSLVLDVADYDEGGGEIILTDNYESPLKGRRSSVKGKKGEKEGLKGALMSEVVEKGCGLWSEWKFKAERVR